MNSVKILVTMEVAGGFPSEYPIYMHDEDGSETEDACAVVYIKPPPICGRCISFGHTSGKCRYVGEPTGEKDIATFAGENNAAVEEMTQMIDGNDGVPNGKDGPRGDDMAQQDEVIGTGVSDMDARQVNQVTGESIDENARHGDDEAQWEFAISTSGNKLNDVEELAKEGVTIDADVENGLTIHQLQQEIITNLIGFGLINPGNLSPSQQINNMLTGIGSGGSH